MPWFQVACFGSGHGAIDSSQLATLDVQCRKLCRSIVGPPPEVDWNAAWNDVLDLWNERVKIFFAHAHVITCFTSHAKMIGIWRGMLPLYLHIGGFNVCYRGKSFWYSSRGPSTTYLGIRTSCVLQDCTLLTLTLILYAERRPIQGTGSETRKHCMYNLDMKT